MHDFLLVLVPYNAIFPRLGPFTRNIHRKAVLQLGVSIYQDLPNINFRARAFQADHFHDEKKREVNQNR
jgi:hypothetical protein